MPAKVRSCAVVGLEGKILEAGYALLIPPPAGFQPPLKWHYRRQTQDCKQTGQERYIKQELHMESGRELISPLLVAIILL